jgi:hypothetical protein
VKREGAIAVKGDGAAVVKGEGLAAAVKLKGDGGLSVEDAAAEAAARDAPKTFFPVVKFCNGVSHICVPLRFECHVFRVGTAYRQQLPLRLLGQMVKREYCRVCAKVVVFKTLDKVFAFEVAGGPRRVEQVLPAVNGHTVPRVRRLARTEGLPELIAKPLAVARDLAHGYEADRSRQRREEQVRLQR